MTRIAFTIPGRVAGKGRARSTLIKPKGKPAFISNYTPAKTRSMEAVIRSLGHDAMAGRPPLLGAASLTIRIFLNPTPSWSKKRQAAAMFATGKPDLDNVVKLVGDALNGIAWSDDAQLCDISISRRYDRAGSERAEITIEELGERA